MEIQLFELIVEITLVNIYLFNETKKFTKYEVHQFWCRMVLRCKKQLQYYLHTGSSMSFLSRSFIVWSFFGRMRI